MIEQALSWVFSTDALVPHGFCLLWRPDLVWSHVIADGAIALSYFTIPLFLVTVARNRGDLLFTWPFYLFGIFILLCGTTHVLSIVAFWVPIYGLEAVVKVATGIASVLTAIAVWPLLPKLLSLPSHDTLQRLNQALEDRVAERTAEVERGNAQLKVLLQEVHHRVKNNLQIIASLLRLQRRHFKDERFQDALDRSIGRVHAMSLVHEALYAHSNLARMSVGDYLRKLIEQVRQADPRAADVDIEVTADETALPVDQSVPLALIANEVVTNALKHAFPEGEPGRIAIAIATADGRTRLTITDDGVGAGASADAADRQSGFGLQIVPALAAQLGGTSAFPTVARGTHFVLEFPHPEEPRVETPRAAARDDAVSKAPPGAVPGAAASTG